MAKPQHPGEDLLPLSLKLDVKRGAAEDALRRPPKGFYDVVIPVRVEIPMTPELRERLRRSGSGTKST